MSQSVNPTLQIVQSHVVPACGVLTTLAIYFSPFKALTLVQKNRDVGSINPLVFPLATCNGLIWVFYGLYVKNYYVSLPNVVGVMLGIYFSHVCYAFTNDANRRRMVLIFMVELGILFIVNCICFIQLSSNANDLAIGKNILGVTTIIILCLFYSAPLTEFKNVFVSRDASLFHLPLAITCLVNGALWVVYGFFVGDLFIYIPNLVGVLSAMLQIFLKFLFRKTCQEDTTLQNACQDNTIVQNEELSSETEPNKLAAKDIEQGLPKL